MVQQRISAIEAALHPAREERRPAAAGHTGHSEAAVRAPASCTESAPRVDPVVPGPVAAEPHPVAHGTMETDMGTRWSQSQGSARFPLVQSAPSSGNMEVAVASTPPPPPGFSQAAWTVYQARLAAEARDGVPSWPAPVAPTPTALHTPGPAAPVRFVGESFEDTLDQLYGPEAEDDNPLAAPVAAEYTDDLDEASWIMMDAEHSDDQLSQSRLLNVHSALRLLRLAQRHRRLVARVAALAAICDHAESQVQAGAAVQPAADTTALHAVAAELPGSGPDSQELNSSPPRQRAWWEARTSIAVQWIAYTVGRV